MATSVTSVVQWWGTWRTVPVFSWIRAAQMYRAGRFARAIQLYRKGLDKHTVHPARFCARMDLAYCLFRSHRYAEAEHELRSVINHSPRLKEAYARLGRLQIWTGRPLEACWTMRRALRVVDPDVELLSIFLMAVLDNGGPAYLLKEALAALDSLSDKQRRDTRLEIVLARLAIYQGDKESGRSMLLRLATGLQAPFEAVVALAEVLLDEGRVANARQQLRRAMLVAPSHPRVLYLFAESYLREGPFQNVDFALQLAQSACQHTGWLGPRELHLLARTYDATGDRLSALLLAYKAKDIGSKLLGNYRHAKELQQLIDRLSNASESSSDVM